MIYYSDNAAFIHTPKTGGTSISLVLRDNGWNTIGSPVRSPWHHTTVAQARELLPDWDDRFTFAFQREQASYAYAFYKYVRWIKSFDDFLDHGNLPAQSAYTDGVSFVGCFERLAEDFRHVADRLGLKGNLPWIGKARNE